MHPLISHVRVPGVPYSEAWSLPVRGDNAAIVAALEAVTGRMRMPEWQEVRT